MAARLIREPWSAISSSHEHAMKRTRRELLHEGSLLAAGTGVVPARRAHGALPDGSDLVQIDPTPLFAISPWLYMQFMEPLGTTDSSVEAAWDHDADDWRRDFVATVADLAPGAIRFGGLLSRYYKWREGVGPPDARPLMRNYLWGGVETNRIGTGEIVGLCRRVGAEPLFCVNFLSDGHRNYAHTREGNRTGDAREAADWVSYCNDPDNLERRRHGAAAPYEVRLWQLGNETSYGEGGFTKDEAIARTIEFARAMRERDPTIRLIGWGDGNDRGDRTLWAGDMLAGAGEHLDLIAIHLMQQRPSRPDTVLRGLRYQREPERAWEELLEIARRNEARLVELEQVLDTKGVPTSIAVTEGHLSLAPHNTNPILLEWLSGVFHARMMNIYQRHGRRVQVATATDFNGTRWTVVAVRLQVPRGISYLTPAGTVMRLFRQHNGQEAVAVRTAPPDLDIAASRTGGRIYLHVANLSHARSVPARLVVGGQAIAGGRVLEIAPDDLRRSVSEDEPDVFAPVEKALVGHEWRFPKGSVSVVELEVA
jgi:alpha-L-arabinofuranosidase